MRKAIAVLALVCGVCAQFALASEAERLANLLEGEFNNGEQVWQQRQDGAPLSTRFHWKWQRLGEHRLSLSVAEGQAAGPPQWEFSFEGDDGALSSEVYEMNGEVPVCAYQWIQEDEGFLGSPVEGRECPDLLAREWRVDSGGLRVSLQVASDERESETLEARRAIHYEGWIALARNKFDENAEPDDFVFLSGVAAHDQGTMIGIVDEGVATGYAVELVQLTYQNTRVAVLKLGIVDEATGETLSYAWANPGAERIGINLRWVQSGFTRK